MPGTTLEPERIGGAIVKKTFCYLTLCAVLLASFSCGKPRAKTGPSIVTPIFPVYDMVRNIAGDRTDVFFVVPPGANPHTFEPPPSAVRKIQGASLFFGIDRRFDGWVEKFLPPGSESVYLKAGPAYDRIHNPHIWLSLKNARRMCAEIAAVLSARSPEDREYYTASLNAYSNKLDALDREIIALFEPVRNRRFFQWHPAWNYFADDYGLTVAGTLQKGHGETVSVRGFKELVDTARRGKIRIVTIGLRVHSPETLSLVKEIDGIQVVLDTIGDPSVPARDSYLKLMEYNAALLAEKMKKQ